MNLPRFTTDLLVDWDYKVESTVTALFLVKQPPRNPVNSLIWYFKTTLSFSKHLTTLHRAPLSVHSSHTSDCIHYYFRWNVSNSDKLHFPLLLSPACLPACLARAVPPHWLHRVVMALRHFLVWSAWWRCPWQLWHIDYVWRCAVYPHFKLPCVRLSADNRSGNPRHWIFNEVNRR